MTVAVAGVPPAQWYQNGMATTTLGRRTNHLVNHTTTGRVLPMTTTTTAPAITRGTLTHVVVGVVETSARIIVVDNHRGPHPTAAVVWIGTLASINVEKTGTPAGTVKVAVSATVTAIIVFLVGKLASAATNPGAATHHHHHHHRRTMMMRAGQLPPNVTNHLWAATRIMIADCQVLATVMPTTVTANTPEISPSAPMPQLAARNKRFPARVNGSNHCLLYTSDAADE